MFRRALLLAVLGVSLSCSNDPENNKPVPDAGADNVGTTDGGVGDTGGSVDLGQACGNGVVDSDELCDIAIPAGSDGACPTECETDACSTATLNNGGTCQAECIAEAVESCCGDGVLQAGESCDTAIAAGQPGACPQTPVDCDDGVECTADRIDGEACQAACVNDTPALCLEAGEPVPGAEGSVHPPELLAVDDELWIFASADNGPNPAPVSLFRYDGVEFGRVVALGGDTTVGIDALHDGTRPTVFAVTGGNQPWVNAYNGANADPQWEWSTFDGESWHAVLDPGQTSTITAAARVDRRIFLFTRLDDGSLEFAAGLAESNFEPYRAVPGGETTDFGPAAFSNDGTITLITAGAGTLRAARYDSGADSWTAWQDFGPAIDAESAADVAFDGGNIVLAVNSGGMAQVTVSADDGVTWEPWSTLQMPDVVGRPSVEVWNGMLYLSVLRDAQTGVYELYSTSLP